MSALAPDLALAGRMVLALVSVLMLLATARWILLRKGLGNMGNTRGADGLVLAATLPSTRARGWSSYGGVLPSSCSRSVRTG
jgi:multisubunit Na+/H+ antiporter MnhB subunit